ncbi:p049 [Rhizobium phage 16-3]|uniref:p049 n=1 Tax=Rhizobium phage 16-3 TaxID=10704 RepID=UPI00017BA604|nr:p049 [Rhizobium phage 16-3]ABF71300.1 p049 [Rhizobium phage 16-3]
MSPAHYRLVMSKVRSIAPRKLAGKPNWALAMDLFCTGSTFGWKACEYAEIDPDGYEIGEIWRKDAA